MRSLCIVGGCGHVGLPLGIAFALAGARVTLYDINSQRVREVAEGHMPFVEAGAEEALPQALESGNLELSHNPEVIGQHEAVVITIGTPVDEFLDPSVRSFDRAIDQILDQMHDGQLLILRSTVFPGITERLARRVKERGLSLDVAYCPERIAQGYALKELSKLPQIVSGVTPTAAERATRLFRLLAEEVIEVSPVEAELAKLFANAYRYMNFAISNQFYLIADKFGADFNRIHEAVTHNYPRLAGFAKAGFAGGPCLLKDTMQLAAFNHNGFVLGQAAMMVNEGLPRALVDSVGEHLDLAKMTAGILGMAFKGNCDDPRTSLAYKLQKVLTLECRRVLCTDPYIQDPGFVSLETVLAEADIMFIGACHDVYRKLQIEQPVVDVFDFLQRKNDEGSDYGSSRVHWGISRRAAA
jgi:UDP-N-acetyl-D-mannosaminuronic acid dehydrogenase